MTEIDGGLLSGIYQWYLYNFTWSNETDNEEQKNKGYFPVFFKVKINMENLRLVFDAEYSKVYQNYPLLFTPNKVGQF